MEQKAIRDIIPALNRDYYLPTIQRSFVWLKTPSDNKIEKLLDSMMCQYPIGQIILWKLSNENETESMSIYEFLQDYDYGKDVNENNSYNNTKNGKDLVLDGQQRLTALNIALEGKIIPKKGEEQYMYINLFHEKDDNKVDDLSFGFSFLSENDASKTDASQLWFRVNKIMDKGFKEVEKAKSHFYAEIKKENKEHEVIINEKDNDIKMILGMLWGNIREKKINCETIDVHLENLLDVFVRLNDGGVKLEKADLLLSFMENKKDIFNGKSARKVIMSFLKEINNRNTNLENPINFKKDDVLKACLMLTDGLEVRYRISNFGDETVQKIADNWENITQALDTTLKLMDAYYIDAKSLPSRNALFPIAYFLMKNNLVGDKFIYVNDTTYLKTQKEVIKWLAFATFSRAFGGSSDTVLSRIRNDIKKDKKLPSKIEGVSKLGEDEIEKLLDDAKYRTKNTQLLLKLVCSPEDWKNQKDHIFPQKMFRKGQELYEHRKYTDSIFNLQLLGKSQNSSKSSQPPEWVEKQEAGYKDENCIPKDMKLNETNFQEFIDKRRELMISHLKKFLSQEKTL